VGSSAGLLGAGTGSAGTALASVQFGCEHTMLFYRAGEKNWKTLLQQYGGVLKCLGEEGLGKRNMIRNGGGTSLSLRPTYLCLQCPHIFDTDGMKGHFEGVKAHSFCEFMHPSLIG
jgi:hypothetical protein